jgi:hypothetical protein
MLKYLSIIVIAFYFFVSFSSPTENEDSDIMVSIENEGIRITNLVSKRIYYFAVEQELLAVIDWGASFSGPSLAHLESDLILYEDICGLKKTIKSGTVLVIFCWDDSNKENPEINGHKVKLTNLPIPNIFFI